MVFSEMTPRFFLRVFVKLQTLQFGNFSRRISSLSAKDLYSIYCSPAYLHFDFFFTVLSLYNRKKIKENKIKGDILMYFLKRQTQQLSKLLKENI